MYDFSRSVIEIVQKMMIVAFKLTNDYQLFSITKLLMKFVTNLKNSNMEINYD